MKLNVDFAQLQEIVRRMGAVPIKWRSKGHAKSSDFGNRLSVGLYEFENWEDVTVTNERILTIDGKVVIVYIKDTQRTEHVALHRPEDNKRFHIADCTTLENMRKYDRYSRYVATRNTSGIFRIDVFTDETQSASKEIEAKLLVCKHCLKTINYRNYCGVGSEGRDTLWRKFSIEAFLKQFDTSITVIPRYDVQSYPGSAYSSTWKDTSRTIRKRRSFICEECGVDLTDFSSALHSHHVNGVKGDNAPGNIRVLCALCHGEQPGHSRMAVDPSVRERIERARAEQSFRARL